MRSDDQMMNLILQTARKDTRILAAYLKGSRTNPNVPKDIYQDFDLMYVVTETKSFRNDPDWLNSFGNIILKQEQDDDYSYGERFGIRHSYHQSYSWLLLFDDGNRIDIGIETLETMKKGINRNKLFLPLLDKTGCLPKLPPPTDEDFHVNLPSLKGYYGCCNEFYWCLCDVIKGIARDELPFAMTTYNTLVREMLELMLCWYAGILHNRPVSCGKLNKYFKNYLPPSLYNEYLQTYTDSNYANFWKAIDSACHLFHKTGVFVGDYFHFPYPKEYERGYEKYCEFIRNSLR